MEIDYSAQTEAFRQFVAEQMQQQTAALERANRLAERSMHSLSVIQAVVIVILVLTLVGIPVAFIR